MARARTDPTLLLELAHALDEVAAGCADAAAELGRSQALLGDLPTQRAVDGWVDDARRMLGLMGSEATAAGRRLTQVARTATP
ncbi:hypothetical protein [Janibacter sp. G1551]|uniref:hypothetical protein n=1 Tax=Janibacter sp. G1551 TaxID=3420440 RepID=UPI003CFE1B14